MDKQEKSPFGYIYRATNIQNGKIYIGQTVVSRWGDDRNPIEERWKEEIREAYARQRRGENLRYIENAIIKHGPENFEVEEQDTAQSQEELDSKETDWIKEYDSMNPDKGYNLKEGGLGGRLSEIAKENISNIISEKYQKDSEYYEKQANERRERANDPEWIEKMTEINRERANDPEWVDKMTNINQKIARNPETQEKISDSLSEKWKEQEYQEKVSKGVTDKWQDPIHREKQFKSRAEGKKGIQDKGEFLRDIQEMKKKDLNLKHDIDGKSMNKRIKEMLGHHGVNNFSQAKKYLEGKNLQEVIKDVNEHMESQSQDFKGKKEISNKQEFLTDIQTKQLKDIAQKYNMNETTVTKRIQEMLGNEGVKNYTEAKKFLEGKNLDKVAKDIDERLSDQSQKYEGKTEISNKREFLEDIQNLQKNEIDMKYGMDAKTVNNKIEEMLGEHGVKNYTEAKKYLQDKNVDDVLKDIEGRSREKQDNNKLREENLDDNTRNSREEDEIKDINKGKSEEKSNLLSKEKSEKTSREEKENISEDLATESVSEPSMNKSKDSSEEADKEQRLETSGPPSKRSDQEIIEENIKSHEEFLDKMKDLEKRGFVDYINDNTIVIKDTSMENWEQWEPDENVGEKDYDGIDNSSDDSISDINSDYDSIHKSSKNGFDDFQGLDEDLEESGKDFEGIDDHTDERCEDYDGIDEEYGGSEYGGEA